MNYEGEKFLLKLYKDLYNHKSVKHSGKENDDKYELIRKYLERLEKSEKIFDGEHKELEKYLKNRYYDKYVIKEEDIPDSYWELQQRIALERGHGHIEYTPELKHKEAVQLIKEQKKSLEKWINYLLSENTSYPMWVRYWAFQGMLKLGMYDQENGRFTKRSKGTTAAFIELNPEALAKTIDTLMAYNNGEDIDDKKLEQLVESGNFGKIYGYNIWKMKEEEKELENESDSEKGVWKTYNKGDTDEVIKSLEGKGTGWCIAGEGMTEAYLSVGDMFIYYTKDSNGEYTKPRVCIRREEGTTVEVRGILKEQNLEPEMYDVTERKLDELGDKEAYKKKSADMRELTRIYDKAKGKNIELTREEYEFLYEMNSEIEGFGWDKDPRIEELRAEYPIKSKELLLEIIQNDVYFIDYAIPELKTDIDVLKTALDIDRYFFIEDDGTIINNKELMIKLIKANKKAFDYVSPELKKDRDIILVGLQQGACSLFEYSESVMDDLKTDRDIVLAAAQNDWRILEYVDEKLRNDREIALAAIKNNAKATQYVTDYKDDKAFVLEIIENTNNPDIIWYWIDRSLREDVEVVTELIRNGLSLEKIPTTMEGYKEIATIAVSHNVDNIKYVPLGLILNSMDIVLAAVKNDVTVLEYIRDKSLGMITRDANKMLEIVKINGLALKYADKKIIENEEIVFEAIKSNPDAIEYASKELLDNPDFMDKVAETDQEQEEKENQRKQ